jgi:hypothetical protein
LATIFNMSVDEKARSDSVRILPSALKVSPAMAAGITQRLWEMKDAVDMLEAWEASQ